MSDEDDGFEIVDLPESSAPQTQGKKFLEVQCPICLDTPSKLVVTPCGHIYCNECVFHALSSSMRATKSKGECSVCKASVRYDKVRYLELKLRPSAAEIAESKAAEAEKAAQKAAQKSKKRKRDPAAESGRKKT